jgi:hypothetical protein
MTDFKLHKRRLFKALVLAITSIIGYFFWSNLIALLFVKNGAPPLNFILRIWTLAVIFCMLSEHFKVRQLFSTLLVAVCLPFVFRLDGGNIIRSFLEVFLNYTEYFLLSAISLFWIPIIFSVIVTRKIDTINGVHKS